MQEVGRRVQGPVNFLEIGPSAGIQLRFDRWAVNIAGRRFGPADAPLTPRPHWRAQQPPPDLDQIPAIRDRLGVDLHPVDATDPEQRLRGSAALARQRTTLYVRRAGSGEAWRCGMLAGPDSVNLLVLASVVLRSLDVRENDPHAAGGERDDAREEGARLLGGDRRAGGVVVVEVHVEETERRCRRAVLRFGGPGPGGRGETALSGATKEKVEAAVLAEYPNATIVRTETNADSSAPYESHITTSDGKELEVLVSEDFEVVEAREHPARP
jgi:hypothetical protein